MSPTTGIAGCCARAVRGHDAAAPPRTLRTSLRLMGAAPSCEDALRARAGSLGIKALLRRVGAQVRINSEGTHAPSEARDCDWTFAVLGSLAPPKARETSTTRKPRLVLSGSD